MKLSSAQRARAFTLIELLVSMAVLTLMMLFLFNIVSMVGKDWKTTAAYSNEFQEAQDAFTEVTRHLSEATLNTYSDYNYSASSTAPPSYVRQSELRFVSGQAGTILAGVNSLPHPTHAIFFVAPLGVSSPYNGLPSLLNTLGYYIEYNSDAAWKPSFVSSVRSRNRLMELMVPSESMSIYNYTSGVNALGTPNCLSYNGYTWFTNGFNLSPSPTHILAENVIALVIQPRISPYATYVDPNTGNTVAVTDPALLAPTYNYDSSPTPTVAAPRIVASTAAEAALLDSYNQLPPLVQVTLVALDEASATRLPPGDVMTYLGLSSLFQDATKYTPDLKQLETGLDGKKLNYRVFTATVAVKGANWSTNQSN